ncbi:MAG: sporulation peptidase YabG [Clostridia bacterium]|nr:sporulation peptidase YabG [Clostridia bacterium]
MYEFQIGDLVARKSYGGDIHFTITDIDALNRSKAVFLLKGLYYRIEADAYSDDLIKSDSKSALSHMNRYMHIVKRQGHGRSTLRSAISLNRLRSRPGKILHIDSSSEFLDMCIKHYKEVRLEPVGILASESQQPGIVRRMLEQHHPDILVVTGHDGFKKSGESRDSVERYRNSKYFVQSVAEARKYQPDFDKLSIFAGACQSYFEGIMKAGANFASSPGRILINALDPAIVSEKIALTDSRSIVTPREVVRLTISGSKGIGGINTRGQLKWL